MKQLLLLCLMIVLAACAPTTQTEPNVLEPTPTSEYDFSGVHLRLHNNSGQDFTTVTLSSGGQTEQIGTLAQNETSEFYTFMAVQQTPAISVQIDETTYAWTAEYDAGSGLIAGGQFTLELALENDKLVVGFLMENPILHDAQYYADEMGVSLEEALFRLDMQNEDAISALNNQLQTNEADTFAGLWLQHEPEYRVVVAFTRNGAETIQKYVADNSELAKLIEVRPAEYTYAQLLADRDEVLRLLDGTHLPVGVGIMVMDNRVVVDVTDRKAFETAIAAATLPDSVVINTVYEPVGETPPFAITPALDVFMPQLKQRDVYFMEALLIGELVVENGCLRVRSKNENYLVIWQADYFLNDNNGILEILDETGTAVSRVGDMIYMGGGEHSAVADAELRQPMPEQCGGPYWRMGEFLPEEYIPNVAPEPISQSQTDDWQLHTISDSDLAFIYPHAWYVHETMKSLQISPASQPTWSSIAVPDPPYSGPNFDLLYNLNRQMGATPLLEVENIIQFYGAESEISVIEPAAPLHDRPDVVIGAYRYVPAEDDLVLLVGAVNNPSVDSLQPTIAMTSVMHQDELATIKPIFETVLRSMRLADPLPISTTPDALSVPSFDTWISYQNPTLDLALSHPPSWAVEENANRLIVTTPYTVVHDSGAMPLRVWVIAHEKFAADASLYDVIVNAYHFEGVIGRFEDTLLEEEINGRTAYRSLIIPAAPGGQMSVFFDDGDRFVEVALWPFDAERPYANQALFTEIFAQLLETITFTE